MVYLIWKGEIPTGLEIAHSCDNCKCFNPDHLTLKTHAENMKEMIERRRGGADYETRFVDGENNVTRARLTPENVVEIRSSKEPAHIFAKRFGVAIETIYRARSGKHWKHIEAGLMRLSKLTPADAWSMHLSNGYRSKALRGNPKIEVR